MTQTNQLLKGVKGEFSALGNKHTRRLLSLSADMHVRASAVIFSLQGFVSRGSLPSGPCACRTMLVPGLPAVTITYYSLSD